MMTDDLQKGSWKDKRRAKKEEGRMKQQRKANVGVGVGNCAVGVSRLQFPEILAEPITGLHGEWALTTAGV
jgi:hypothetical protein